MQLVLAMIYLMDRSLSCKQQSLTHYHTSSFSYSTLVNQCLYEGSRLIYVICVCLRIVVSNTYCVVFLIYLSSSCVPYVSSFSGLSIFWLPLRHSLTFTCPVSCVPYVASFSGLSIFWLPLRHSLTFTCPVSCVPYAASFSGLSIFWLPLRLVYIMLPVSLDCPFFDCPFVLCTLCCQFLSIVHFLITPSVFVY